MHMNRFSETQWRVAIGGLSLVFLAVVLKDAWLCDDAYIAFRTVDNFVNGYGLRWNVAERVQSYTHPLWLFLLSGIYMVSGEIFYTSIVLSVVVSVAAVVLFAGKLAPTPLAAVCGLCLMICSKAFVDYSTSGLENPLTHLLLALFLAIYIHGSNHNARTVFLLALIAALALINRMDTGLIYLPALISIARRQIKVLIFGLSPFLIWEGFSLFYYGFPFPNTAYAKLNTGIERSVLFIQGLHYLVDAFRVDPLTPLTLIAGSVLPFVFNKKPLIPVVLGIGLYVLYVVWIGGDFMTGRFLTGPFFCAVVLTVRSLPPLVQTGKFVLACALLMGLLVPRSPLRSGFDYGEQGPQRGSYKGVADERAWYYAHTRLWRPVLYEHPEVVEGHRLRRKINPVVFHFNAGYFGFYAGPEARIVDFYGLTDPLLSRLHSDCYLISYWANGGWM